jgi:hypothetical protein
MEGIENENIPIKSKRGRKKKWDNTNFKNYTTNVCPPLNFAEKTVNQNIEKEPNSLSGFNDLNFGNLTIKIKAKEQQHYALSFTSENKKSSCLIDVSDEEDQTNYKLDYIKNIKHKSDKEITNINIRCYYCHHLFDNKPFYIPLKYSETLNRYKLFGNFCSPNCAKSYCISSKLLESKTHLLCKFYRELFGPSFKFSPAPCFLRLKEYGGNLSIEEFRKVSYTSKDYILNNVICDVITLY